jgi:diguanylate cyclase (GGDEF)-like protein
VANLPSGDRRVDRTRAIEGQQESVATPESACPSEDGQALSRVGDAESDKAIGSAGERGFEHRQDAAGQLVRSAAARDEVAHARDVAAVARDQIATLQDRELTARDAERADAEGSPDGTHASHRAPEHRRRAARDRAAAAEGRARAASDREHAARDREHAARDRLHAQADREALLRQLTIAETDALTGARTRAAGLGDLEHEIDRSRRTSAPLVVAYLDVVGLKAVNDSQGHGAGDALLRRVVGGIRSHMRSYDLIVRLGGDEFLCAMSGATRNDARTRFRAIQVALASGPDPCEIRVGFAALSPQDSAGELIERADAELPIAGGRSVRSVDPGGAS